MYLTKVHYKNNDVVDLLTKQIKDILQKESEKETIYVCIGTDRVVGDSLGPIIGEMVSTINNEIKIYGKLGDAIHANNIPKKFKQIKFLHKDSNIIAIDASIGCKGMIIFKEGPVKPGEGVGLKLETIGNYSINAVTDSNITHLYKKSMNNTELDFVKELAGIISLSILLAHRDFNHK